MKRFKITSCPSDDGRLWYEFNDGFSYWSFDTLSEAIAAASRETLRLDRFRREHPGPWYVDTSVIYCDGPAPAEIVNL